MYIEYEGVIQRYVRVNRVVNLPCIDTPLGGREVRLTVDFRNPFTFMSSLFLMVHKRRGEMMTRG